MTEVGFFLNMFNSSNSCFFIFCYLLAKDSVRRFIFWTRVRMLFKDRKRRSLRSSNQYFIEQSIKQIDQIKKSYQPNIFIFQELSKSSLSIPLNMSTLPLEVQVLKEIPTSVQIIETLKNLQKINPINLESPQFQSSLRQYAQQHMVLYKYPTEKQDSTYVCFLKQQRLDESYVNQVTGEIIKVRELEGAIVQRKQSEQAKLTQDNQKKIKFLYQKLLNYLNQHFSRPYGAACHFKLSEQKKILQIVIGMTSKLNNIQNFYTGQWTSYWVFGPTKCEGKINVRNHFFEGGNLLFHRQKLINKELSKYNIDFGALKEEDLQKMIKLIKKQEILYLKQLQSNNSQSLSQSLRKIRRLSPLTQGKMVWNLNAALISEQLNKQSQSLA